MRDTDNEPKYVSGRHRKDNPYFGRHRSEELRAAARRAVARPAAAVLLVSMGVASFTIAGASVPDPGIATPANQAALDNHRRRADEAASRSLGRTPSPSTSPSASPTASPAPKPSGTSPKPTRTTTKTKPSRTATVRTSTTRSTPPKPVGGLSQRQMNHAATIVRVGQELDLPKRAYVIAIATALQESSLRNLANSYYPESLDM